MSVRSREAARERVAARLLDSLDDLVRRHRSLAPAGPHGLLHADLIAGEVAHELAMARSALRRVPPIPDPPAVPDVRPLGGGRR
jgi:hypothetical protein